MDKSKLKILLAENHAELRKIIKDYLKADGYEELSITENGKSALAKLKSQAVDLIIADAALPEINGLELLAEVRRDNSLKEIPFLLVASEVNQEFVAKAAELGVDGYMIKPFSHQVLSEKVESIFERKFHPDAGLVTAKDAQRMLEAGDLDGALEKFQEALESTKTAMASLHHKVGGVYEKLERDEEAEDNYHKSIKMSALFVKTYDALGSMKMRQGDEHNAANFLKTSVIISPLSPDRQFKLGEALLGTDEFEDAEKAFKISLKIDPQQTHIFNRLGMSLRRQGKLKESVSYFQRALSVTKDDENLYFNAGQVLVQMDEKTNAVPFLKKALELNPQFDEARELLEQISS
ncbi:MAG: response regulator [Deltaproteobacteria bacterium]|nr:response regulator [Deltaproteobacteria bacterium]